MKRCSICEQRADIYTATHRKEPFADGRLYDTVCFTCYFVPKTVEQKYSSDGSVSEEVEFPYSCELLYSAKELHESGAADSTRQAKVCVEAVKKLAFKSLKQKHPRKRPKPSWNIG